MLLQKLLELTKDLKKSKIKPKGILNVFADTETSYINNAQILIADPHKRERYADMLGYYITEVENGFSKNSDDFKYFTGKDCIENFLLEMFKLVFNGNTTKVWFYNLDYDGKYINYILSLAGITNKNNQGFEVEMLRNENVLYQIKITYRQKSSRKKYKKVYQRDENGKYLLNEKGNKIYKKEEILDENGNVVYEENVYSLILNDAMKLFAGGVDTLGEAIGFKKLEFEYNNVRDYNYIYSKKEIEYLKRDCYIVKETFVLSTLINQLCNVSNKFTIGGCAFSKYINEFLPTHINGKDFRDKNDKVKFEYIFPNSSTCKDSIPSRDSQGELTNKYYTLDYIFSVIYDGYFGGLSQCNPINQGKIIVNENSEFKDWLLTQATIKGREILLTPKREITIDINSLYPFIMYIAKIPYGMPSIIEYPTEEQLKEIIKGKKFVLVEIDNIYGDLKQNKMPIIPKNRNNKLNTNCNYEQTLYGKSLIRNYEEFLLDKQHYNLVNYEIKRAFVFNAVQGEIFKDYVDYFFKMKCENNENKVLRNVAKLFLNSLYGKFGQNNESISVIEYFDENTGEWTKEMNTEDIGYKYPPVAMAVTSYARIYMVNLIDKLDWKDFLYMDTDSCHFLVDDVDNIGELQSLIDDLELGKFKIEHKPEIAIYLAPKKYAMYEFVKGEWRLNITCAGLPDDAKESITNILDFYYGYESESKKQKYPCIGGYDICTCKYRINNPNDKSRLVGNRVKGA